MIQTYHEECIQAYYKSWWLEDSDKPLPCRGRLIRAFIPHVDQVPMALVPRDRTDNVRQHQLADCDIMPLDYNSVMRPEGLPVAGIPCFPKEARGVYRVKKRPALILAMPGEEIPKSLILGKPRHQTLPTFIIAPYYGADESTGSRAGFSSAFLDRVRRLEYSRFFWDKLPILGVDESILRIDHMQPLGTNYKAWENTSFRLSDDALSFMEEIVQWHMTGEFIETEESLLPSMRRDMMLAAQ